jgi:hypothetical protein
LRTLSPGARPVEPHGVELLGEPLSEETQKAPEHTPFGGVESRGRPRTIGAYSRAMH